MVQAAPDAKQVLDNKESNEASPSLLTILKQLSL